MPTAARSTNRQGTHNHVVEFRFAKTTRASCFIKGDVAELFPDIWSVEATDFIAALHREFAQSRRHILHYRKECSGHRLHGGSFEFLSSTAGIRNDPDWRVPQPPQDLIDRRVEIAGPAENRKIVINALNAHAQVWVANLEDAMSPTWHNAMASQ
jgi:malate synthase